MSGCGLPTVSYGEFSRKVHSWSSWESGGRVPLSIGIEPTARCNLRCTHCYVPGPAASAVHGELDAAEWKEILDRAAELGTFYLLITGGEPFVRDDILEIYRHAKRLGMLVTLFTNGTLLEPGDLQFLNNRLVLHGRTSFEDYPELERKRHLLRVWLKMPDWAPWPDNMYWHEKGYRLSESVAPYKTTKQGELA